MELCKAQVFTTKDSFIRLLYKLILVHSYSSHLNLGIEFHARTQKNFEVSVSQSKKLLCLGLAEKNALFAFSQGLGCAETETVALHVDLRLHSAALPHSRRIEEHWAQDSNPPVYSRDKLFRSEEIFPLYLVSEKFLLT